MNNLDRLRKLSGITEDEYLDPEDNWDAVHERADKIKKIIEIAFKKLGLDIVGIFYDEENDREAIIQLDDTEIG
jgi:hypothetical protein